MSNPENNNDKQTAEYFEKIIRDNRKMLTPSSIKVYMSNIRSVQKDLNKKFNSLDDVVENHKAILDMLIEKYKPSIRKTKLASLIVLLDRKDENPPEIDEILKIYRKQLFLDADNTQKEERKQKLINKNQEEAYIPWADVEAIYEDLKTQCMPLFKLKKLDSKIFNKIQQFVLLSCYVLIPPRRSKDYADFRIKDPDTAKDNFMTIIGKKKVPYFVFNSYKNANKLGKQQIEIPNELKNIILKWTKIAPSDWLISTKEGKKITQVRINQILSDIFDPKNIGSSMLRHIYLTEKFGNVDLENIEDVTEQMGNSQITRTLKYVSKEHAEKEEEKKE